MFQTSLIRRTEAVLENEVEVRMIRQRRLSADEHPLELVAIVDESVLHRPVGGSEVMGAQLARLRSLALSPADSVKLVRRVAEQM